MTTVITGVGKLSRQLKKLTPAVATEVSKQIIKGAFKIQADAVQSIQRGPNTGVVYDKGKGISHQASAPGEAPASDTGNLARRIEIRLSTNKLRADIGITNLLFTPYARVLELGGEFIEKRPYMKPAFDKNIKAINAAISAAVRKGLK